MNSKNTNNSNSSDMNEARADKNVNMCTAAFKPLGALHSGCQTA